MSVAILDRPGTPAVATSSRALSITARGLSKSFGDRPVIANLDLHVPAGQFLAVVGRSGCGKSTLLRLLSGLEQPDGGTLRFGDAKAGAMPQADVRLMFQEPRLLPWAKVAGNVEIGLGLAGGTAQGKRCALDTLAQVGLEDRADLWPSPLSGGQKQRVALARALVSKPRILSFDEPLGALDALTRIEMQRLIERVFIEQAFTALLVTHDVAEALALADRIIVLEKGGISLDVDVPLDRPRRRGSSEAAALEERILAQLLGSES